MIRESAATRTQPRRFVLFGAIAVSVLLLDLATKEIALTWFSALRPVELLGGFLKLTLTFNSGAAFSIGEGYPWVFTLVAIGVIGYILWMSRRLRSLAWTISLGLILGGATGNLVDRIFRAPGPLQGHVVDWIQVPHWPVFNIADSGIVCGGVLAVLLAFRGINLDGSRGLAGDEDSAGSGATPPEGGRG